MWNNCSRNALIKMGRQKRLKYMLNKKNTLPWRTRKKGKIIFFSPCKKREETNHNWDRGSRSDSSTDGGSRKSNMGVTVSSRSRTRNRTNAEGASIAALRVRWATGYKRTFSSVSFFTSDRFSGEIQGDQQRNPTRKIFGTDCRFTYCLSYFRRIGVTDFSVNFRERHG